MDGLFSVVIRQLAFQAPMIIVCAVGLVLAVIWFQRAPLPFALMGVATFLLLVMTLTQPIAQARLEAWHREDRGGHELDEFAFKLLIIGLFSNVVRAAAVGLLVWAVSLTALPIGQKNSNPTR
jgi:hypothetical protein